MVLQLPGELIPKRYAYCFPEAQGVFDTGMLDVPDMLLQGADQGDLVGDPGFYTYQRVMQISTAPQLRNYPDQNDDDQTQHAQHDPEQGNRVF